jgi:hypothetical protein
MTPIDVECNHVETRSMISDTNTKSLVQLKTFSNPVTSSNEVATHFTPQLQNGLSELWQYGEYPELAAGAEYWAFQGVDAAFFESLMRSTGNERDKDAEWTSEGRPPMNEDSSGSYYT